MTNSLALRLLLTTVLALAMVFAILTLGIGYLLHQHPDLLDAHSLQEEADMLIRGLRFDPAGRPVSITIPNQAQWLYTALPDDTKYRLLDTRGRPLLSSEPGGQALSPAGKPFDPALRQFEIRIAGHALSVHTFDVGPPHNRYLLQVAGSLRLGDVLRRVFTMQAEKALTFNLSLALLIFAAVLFCVFHHMLKPLRRASQETEQITPRSLGVRLTLDSMPCELYPLIESFNDSLARLEKGFQVQQEFLAAAAHELKTPLTLLRAGIEMEDKLEDKSALLREADLMARHVQQLLQLAELSEIQNYQFAPTTLASVAEETVGYLQRRAAMAGVEIELILEQKPDSTLADASAVFVLLKNILENAILHTPQQGTVRVLIREGEIRICDQGPGIQPQHLPHLFTRFWRAPGNRYDGAGLGLAICLEIAQAHGWLLQAINNDEGAIFKLRWRA
ncbi:sensor histidine kinase [Paludibacterium yongneupense]|uniref:sensor histidine kinase n=1 Tax=Paludibacterium yongneupense TaxID=400061 RepID=UPI001C040CAB|nr:ATP-binding protein [Paludibacterium yongneupense]